MPNLRKPAVAGSFYPAQAETLRRLIASYVEKDAKKKDYLACILPHAGYIYSGKVAVATLSRIKIRDKIVLIGPNHSGFGATFSLMSQGSWQTPLGDFQIDSLLAKEILKASPHLQEDTLAHLNEHSLEVQLPLVAYFKPDFKFVPLTLYPAKLDKLKEIGSQIASGIIASGLKDSIILIASSDLTHYEPLPQAEKKDALAIEAMLKLDAELLFERVERFDISMCGCAAAVVMLTAAKALGAASAELVKYLTSAEETKDASSVVGYAGILIN